MTETKVVGLFPRTLENVIHEILEPHQIGLYVALVLVLVSTSLNPEMNDGGVRLNATVAVRISETASAVNQCPSTLHPVLQAQLVLSLPRASERTQRLRKRYLCPKVMIDATVGLTHQHLYWNKTGTLILFRHLARLNVSSWGSQERFSSCSVPSPFKLPERCLADLIPFFVVFVVHLYGA